MDGSHDYFVTHIYQVKVTLEHGPHSLHQSTAHGLGNKLHKHCSAGVTGHTLVLVSDLNMFLSLKIFLIFSQSLLWLRLLSKMHVPTEVGHDAM